MRRWVSLPSHIKIVGVFLCELWDEMFLSSCGAFLSFPAEQTEAVGESLSPNQRNDKLSQLIMCYFSLSFLMVETKELGESSPNQSNTGFPMA